MALGLPLSLESDLGDTPQLYNVINGRNAVTPEMAVRFEGAFDGGVDVWLRMQAAHDFAKVRQSQMT